MKRFGVLSEKLVIALILIKIDSLGLKINSGEILLKIELRVQNRVFIPILIFTNFQEGFIIQAKWPEIGETDEILLKEGQFLESSVRDFRLRLLALLNPKKKTPGQTIQSPTKGNIYVAEKYPSWQNTVLGVLKELYNVIFVLKNVEIKIV